MKRLLYNSVLFLGILFSQQIIAQPYSGSMHLRIQILDFDSKQPINKVSISSSDSTAISNHQGYFELSVSRRDTLVFSKDNYTDLRLAAILLINKGQVFLKKKNAIMLNEVIAEGKKTNNLLYMPKDTLKDYYWTHEVDTAIKTGDSRKFGGKPPIRNGNIFTLHGIFEEIAAQFHDKEQERRKYLDIKAYEHWEYTYYSVLDDPFLRIEFKNQYGISEDKFLSYKAYFHQRNEALRQSKDSEKIRKAFFSQYLAYIQAAKYAHH